MNTNNTWLLYGDGGHAESLRDIIKDKLIVTIINDQWKTSLGISNIMVLGVGLVREHPRRSVLFNNMEIMGYKFPNVIHKSAHIESSAKLGNGVQVFANAVIGTRAVIGDNCIINSGAIISHDCVLGNNVHVAPGATLGGDVIVGNDTLIGLGSSILPGVLIGERCLVKIGDVIKYGNDVKRGWNEKM